jgi:group I intron endonuclease
MMGVYEIRNKINNKVYIGSATNITTRWNQHIENLLYNIHVNYKLQEDYNKYGISAFSFSILEIVKEQKHLFEKEQEYIDGIDIENNYNILSYSNYEYVDRVKQNYDILNFNPNEYQKTCLKNNINILNHIKMNSIGEDKTNLSKSWFNKAKKEDLKRLQNNIYNFYSNISNKKKKIYWTTFTSYQKAIAAKGTVKRFVSLVDIPKEKCNNIAYIANNFVNPIIKRTINIDDDMFALKILLRWIINVADIVQPINLYIPSKRMRDLLIDWLNNENL